MTKNISIDSSTDQYVISIDKSKITKETLFDFVENLRTELLANKVNFNDDIDQLAEKIKEEWWEENKKKYIPHDHL